MTIPAMGAGCLGTVPCAMFDGVGAPMLERGTPRVVTNHATAKLIKTQATPALKRSYISAPGGFCGQAGAGVVQWYGAPGHDGAGMPAPSQALSSSP